MRRALASIALASIVSFAHDATLARAPESPATDSRFFQLTGAVPIGFEHLVGPQSVLVDVYYGDRSVGATLATYEPGRIEFHRPEEIVDGLPDLDNAEIVLSALRGTLDTNTDALCTPSSAPHGCGRLEPAIAGVIFDESRFRVDVFVNATFRKRFEPELDRYLPPSQASFSFLQNLNLNTAGGDVGSTLTSFTSQSTLAWRENRLVGALSYTDENDLSLDGLFARRDFRGREYQAGLFRTAGRFSVFAGDFDLVGYRMATSLRTRTDLAVARGTPVEVFLLAPARIDILQAGRLISSRSYPAGNHKLDTSNLPEGAYDITLRINEGGRVREETRFFSKTSRVPPRDQALSTLEVGRVVDIDAGGGLLPEDADAWFTRAGFSQRLTDTLGYDLGVTSTQDERLMEVGLFQIARLPGPFDGYYELQANTFASQDGDRGYAFNGLLRRGRFSAQLNYRRIDRDEPMNFERLAAGEFSLVPEDRKERSAILRFPVGAGTLSFTSTRNERPGADAVDAHAANFRYPLRFGSRGQVELTADVGRADGNYAALFGVRVNFWKGPWNLDVAPRVQRADAESDASGDGLQVDSLLAYTNRNSQLGDLRASLRAGAGVAEDRLGARLEVDNVLGRADIDVERANRNGTSSNAWAASFSTSLMAGGDHWAVGAQNAAQAALVVDLQGTAPGARFEVLIDGYRRGYAPVGRSTAIMLAPFRTYEVRIRPVGGEFLAFDDRVEQVTLYPGNVERVSWEVGQLVVVVGKVVDLDSGLPLAGASLEGVYGMAPRTDEHGYFQAELVSHGGPLELGFRRGDERCAVGIWEYELTAGVALLDTLGCQLKPAR